MVYFIMRQKQWKILIFLLLSCGFLIRTLQAQENFEVRQVSFYGNKTLKKDFLLERMAIKEVSWLEKVVTKKEPFLYNNELFKLDAERLTKVYQREGFLQANIQPGPLQVNQQKETVKISFRIDEGDPIRVGQITLKIRGEVPSVNLDSLKNSLFRELNLKKGVRFRDEFIKRDKQTIDDAFKNMGYAYALTRYSLDLKTDAFVTDIHFSVDPGPSTKIGETTVVGNQHVSTNFIEKQLPYKKGDLYNKSLLSETRQKLYGLHLFSIVSVFPKKDMETRQSPVPVKITIEEAPRLSTRMGAGYGTEDKLRAFLDLDYKGFFGGARRLNLQVKHSALEPYSVRLRWIQPQLFGTKSSISLHPYILRKSEPGYETRSYGINIPLDYPWNDVFSSKLTGYFEHVEQRVELGDPEFEAQDSDRFLYNKSGFLFSTVFNNSDPLFSPEEGLNLSIGIKLNGYLFGGDFNYTRVWGDLRKYQNTGPLILAFRLMAGGIHSADASGFIPVEDRFYSGGSNSIRGWNRSQLGPKRDSGTPLGGKSILESNFEIRCPLLGRLRAVAFFEAGNVWKNSFSYNLKDLGYAAGPGLRIKTPVGPVRMDLGFPLWSHKTNPQFFISVGQAF